MQSISNALKKISRARAQPVHGLLSAMAAMALALTACGENPQQPPVPKTAPDQLFQQERSALEKAKGVEQALEKQAEEAKQEMERQAK